MKRIHTHSLHRLAYLQSERMLNGNEIAKEQYEHIALYIFISFAPLNSAPTPITSQLTDLLCNAAVRYTKHTIYKLYILQY